MFTAYLVPRDADSRDAQGDVTRRTAYRVGTCASHGTTDRRNPAVRVVTCASHRTTGRCKLPVRPR